MNKSVLGVGEVWYLGPMKREAGVSPARSRRCNRGVLLPLCIMHNVITGIS